MGLVWRSRTSLVGQLIGLVRLVASFAAQLFYRPSDAVAEEYHKWYYGNLVWTKTTYMGINCWKSVSDMWNYQEILSELQPSLVIEFGTRYGGSAVYFANIMRQISHSRYLPWTTHTKPSIQEPGANQMFCSLNRHPPTRRLPNKFNASKTNTLARSSPS